MLCPRTLMETSALQAGNVHRKSGSVHELMELSVDALEVFDLVLQCVPRMDGQDKASSLNESKIGSDRPNGSFIAARRGSDLSVPYRGDRL